MLGCAFRRLLLGLLTSLALAVVSLSVPVIPGAVTAAQAQMSAEFQEALDSYGHWARSERFGEVWVPDNVPPDWRPYQYGHWVYTDEWGWYWISDPEEEDFGWVVYHYGRWARSRELGWFWIPGDEWAPAWVDWRYGGDYVGWAPLPPDELVDEYDDDASYWVFVPPRYIGAPRWRTYMVRRDRHDFAFRSSRVVNRTLGYGRGRAAINAGVSPAFIARSSRSAVPTYRVSPRVLAGTQGVSGAVRVSPQQLQAGRQQGGDRRGRRAAPSGANAVAVQRTAVIQPSASAAAPQPTPLGKGERGKVGSHPPRAAQGGPPPQQQQQQAPSGQQQRQQGAPPSQPPVQRQEEHRPPQTAPTAPSAPSQPVPPPPVHNERPIAPQPPPPAQQEHRQPPPPPPPEHRPPPPQEHRAPPPPQEHRAPPPPPPHPAAPPPPKPQPPAAKPAPPPAKPAPPPKPAPKPEEKKPETPK